MSVAVKRISEVMELLASSGQGATAAEVAGSLAMGRQAASRLLDAMVANGVAEKDPVSRRYRLSLRVYGWGSSAAGRFAPSILVRYEIGELAEDIEHPVFYAVLHGSDVVTLERTQKRMGRTLTVPDFRRNPWQTTSSGRALAAFQPEDRLNALLRAAGLAGKVEAREDIETIQRQGYAASEAVRVEGYTLAAPILDESGIATAAIGVGVNKHIPEEREVITRKLLDTAARVSSNAGYGAMLLNA